MGEAQPARLIFDGDCGFCASCAAWARRHGHGRVEPVAWQALGRSGLAQLGLSVEEAEQAAWWVDSSGRLYRGHRAAGHVLGAAGGWKRAVGWLMLVPPTSWLAAGVYRLVVRYRSRLPGRSTACGSSR